MTRVPGYSCTGQPPNGELHKESSGVTVVNINVIMAVTVTFRARPDSEYPVVGYGLGDQLARLELSGRGAALAG